MKTYNKEIKALLEAGTSATAHEGYAHKSAKNPLIVYSIVGYPSSKVITGFKTKQEVVAQLILVADNITGIDAILSEMELMDNTSNDDFQKIYFTNGRLEPSDSGVNMRRFMVNLNLTL